PPVLRKKNGTFAYFKSKGDFVLAGMDGIQYRKFELQLEPGDTIYFYTDGVTEAKNKEDEFFGEDRLLQSLNEKRGLSVEEICKKVKRDMDAFVGDEDQFDDITMLCVKLNEKRQQGTLSLKPTLESLDEVADFLTEYMDQSGVPQKDINKMLVAMDEIYSNISYYSGADWAKIEYSGGEGEVLLTFRDNGKPYNPLEAEDPDITLSAEERSIGGLGVYMVRQMMDQVEYTYEDGCNVLTLTMRYV
ncbi:MAG: SpoIIE family protein phosphatase, partial [Bacillota bacterium]|nr:SpoIIE family protein phosphatase [Bacillota bacterium]